MQAPLVQAAVAHVYEPSAHCSHTAGAAHSESAVQLGVVQAISVQLQLPSAAHEHVLQPSGDGRVSPGWQPVHPRSVQTHSPLSPQKHELQPSSAGNVSPG